MKTIKIIFFLAVIMILSSCEDSHEILIENEIEMKNDVSIFWITSDNFLNFQIQVNSHAPIVQISSERGGGFDVKSGDSITVTMNSGQYNYSHVGVYGYMGTLVEDECVYLNCVASVTFIVPSTIETLNILGTGECICVE